MTRDSTRWDRTSWDFFCFEHKLVIEVDGGQHNEPEVETLDKERTAWLEGEGYKVLRFWNSEVIGNIEGVMARISEALEGRVGSLTSILSQRERR